MHVQPVKYGVQTAVQLEGSLFTTSSLSLNPVPSLLHSNTTTVCLLTHVSTWFFMTCAKHGRWFAGQKTNFIHHYVTQLGHLPACQLTVGSRSAQWSIRALGHRNVFCVNRTPCMHSQPGSVKPRALMDTLCFIHLTNTRCYTLKHSFHALLSPSSVMCLYSTLPEGRM